MKTKCITSPKAAASHKVTTDLVTIILLCDSPGYRMKSYGPLPLINISNKKLIDLQIQAIQQTFINSEIILCVGFDAEKICKYVRTYYNRANIRIVENQLFNSCNSCESARIALNNTLNDKVLICDGNLLLSNKSLSLIRSDETCVLTETNPSENLEIGININEKNDAEYFSFGARTIWSEILYLHNFETIELFRKIIVSQDNKAKFLFEALNELLKTKHKIKCIPNKNPLQKISNIKTYHAIKDKL